MPAIEEVRKHNTPASCWVIVHGLVYDVSEFLPKHPGGSASILRYAGKDATDEFDAIHPPNTMEDELPKDKHLGPAEGAMGDTAVQPKQEGQGVEGLMPIEACVNLNDLELAAKKNLSEHAWIYYSSAAQDRATYDRNIQDWKRISFRPRVMRDVSSVNMQQSILGFRSNLPLFIAPCALGRLGHPDGELCLVRGAAHANTPYCPSNSTSVSHQALAECLSSEGIGGCLLFQLYVKTSRAETIANVEMARKLGYKALIITIDTNVVGVREDDDRRKIRQALENGQKYVSPWQAALANQAAGVVPRAYHSPTLNWKDLEWIRRAWQNAGPICLKGILTAEDAKIACDMGVDGIYLSNHGGRQLDHAPSALAVLTEIRLYYPQVLRKTEVFVDGGVRRGTDVLKALCLGATAVGLGRPFMYALSAYGTDGVHKAFEMLQDEIATGMRLLGATSVRELNSDMVNPRELESLITSVPPPIGQRSNL